MSESNLPTDLETLELYLDRELAADEASRVDARLAAEPALNATLGRLRRQRASRQKAKAARRLGFEIT